MLACTLLALASLSGSQRLPSFAEPLLSIDAGQSTRPVKLRQGYLHGIADEGATAKTLALIDELKPAVWRLSNLYGTHEFLRRNRFASKYGTQVVYNLQDVFSSIHGNPVTVSRDAKPGGHGFRTFHELQTSWSAFVDQFMKFSKENGWKIDYYDLFSEPDWSWKGITEPQIFELLKVAHDQIRRHEPEAKIVAPSVTRYSDFGPGGPRKFCEYLAANEIRLDALTWHEFDTPEKLVEHVADARDIIRRTFATKPKLSIKEIHVNEYGPPQNHLIPGWTVAWLEALERAGVDVAGRAGWDVTDRWNDCQSGLNGLLMSDNESPQPLFWVHRAYAQMPANRLTVLSRDKSVVALASSDRRSKEIRVLVGRFSGGAAGYWLRGAGRPKMDVGMPPLNVSVGLKGISSKSVKVSRERIPNASLPHHLRQPTDTRTEVLAVKEGRVELRLSGFKDGDAWTLAIRPGS